MEVAIGIDGEWLVIRRDREIGFWFFARFEEDEASALLGKEVDPFDIMVLKHRMDDRTDFDMDEIAFPNRDWDVFLHCRFNSVGLDFGHWLAAARWGAADFIDFGDDRSAEFAFVEFNHD